jgi:gentisate 1,2-dioxygenase
VASTIGDNSALASLEERMKAFNLRGQWQVDANRPQRIRKGPQNQVSVEPSSSGVAHAWSWNGMKPFLDASLGALTESYTARRSLIMANPGLPRGTTHTMFASMQIIAPGEMAWAHRHTANAFRFIIQGGPDVYTVVDGAKLVMEPYDLILTPGWMWHDHHNQSGKPAIWLDGLDVPFALMINQNFYEELGEAVQDQRADADTTPFRYPWAAIRPKLEAKAAEGAIDPREGAVIDYASPAGGPTFSTIHCRMHLLPPGFEGAAHRHTSSIIFFGVEGEGAAIVEDKELPWSRHDTVVVPNWSWLRLRNRSNTEAAIVFSTTDAPIVKTFGFYREETAKA